MVVSPPAIFFFLHIFSLTKRHGVLRRVFWIVMLYFTNTQKIVPLFSVPLTHAEDAHYHIYLCYWRAPSVGAVSVALMLLAMIDKDGALKRVTVQACYSQRSTTRSAATE